MDGVLFESRVGRLIACIVFNVAVFLPLVFEIIFSRFDLSGANSATYAWVLLASCVTGLNYVGKMTDIKVISSLARTLHSLIFYGVTVVVLILNMVMLFGDGTLTASGFVSAKQVGYFGFFYFTNTFLNGINSTRETKNPLEYQNARWILLFAASAAVIPVSLAFQAVLTYPVAVSVCLFFVIFDTLYSLPSIGERPSIVGVIGKLIVSVMAIVMGIVLYANGISPVVNACFISFAALTAAYYIGHYILGGKRGRETTKTGDSELAMCFIFPAAILVAGVCLGFLSLIRPWVIAISAPASMIVMYIVVKAVLYPKESAKERENRRAGGGGPISVMQGDTNRDIADKICSMINYADLGCGTYNAEFLAHARASVSGVTGNTITVRVGYEINFHPDGRSQPDYSEDKEIRSGAARQVKNYFDRYRSYLRVPYSIDFEY